MFKWYFCSIYTLVKCSKWCYSVKKEGEKMDKEKKNSPARIAANNRYNERAYDRINVAVPKGVKKQIEEHIKNTSDASVNAFVKRAINEAMERDNGE